jgi:hypothetical protein
MDKIFQLWLSLCECQLKNVFEKQHFSKWRQQVQLLEKKQSGQASQSSSSPPCMLAVQLVLSKVTLDPASSNHALLWKQLDQLMSLSHDLWEEFRLAAARFHNLHLIYMQQLMTIWQQTMLKFQLQVQSITKRQQMQLQITTTIQTQQQVEHKQEEEHWRSMAHTVRSELDGYRKQLQGPSNLKENWRDWHEYLSSVPDGKMRQMVTDCLRQLELISQKRKQLRGQLEQQHLEEKKSQQQSEKEWRALCRAELEKVWPQYETQCREKENARQQILQEEVWQSYSDAKQEKWARMEKLEQEIVDYLQDRTTQRKEEAEQLLVHAFQAAYHFSNNLQGHLEKYERHAQSKVQSQFLQICDGMTKRK